MVIVVATDQHLGYINSNSRKFSDFLDELSKRNNVTDFVLLGDFIDMWRRDVSGLFLEFDDILQQILSLKTKMNVYCVAGNHDFHLLKLTSGDNPFKNDYHFEFLQQLDLPQDKPKYLFRHGWEFDPMQHQEIMEILCHNLSDQDGQIRSDIWNILTKTIKTDIIDKVEEIFSKFDGKDNYLIKILQSPNQRLKSNLGFVESQACNYSKQDGQILIFGHTHRPFVNTTNNVVNAGSWVSDAQTTDTYVELDGDNIRLIQYDSNTEITVREKCPP